MKVKCINDYSNTDFSVQKGDVCELEIYPPSYGNGKTHMVSLFNKEINEYELSLMFTKKMFDRHFKIETE